MNDQQKAKILWVRALLKKNAPAVYKYFASRKLQGTEQVKAPDSSPPLGGSPSKRKDTSLPIKQTIPTPIT